MNASPSRAGSRVEQGEHTCYTTELDRHLHRYFEVLHTTRRTQVATMTIQPGKEAGPPEVHETSDQIFLVLRGRAAFRIWEDCADAEPRELEGGEGFVLVVPAGTRHWVGSVGDEPLSFFTVYGPPEY